jgi:hypothetical protein
MYSLGTVTDAADLCKECRNTNNPSIKTFLFVSLFNITGIYRSTIILLKCLRYFIL